MSLGCYICQTSLINKLVLPRKKCSLAVAESESVEHLRFEKDFVQKASQTVALQSCGHVFHKKCLQSFCNKQNRVNHCPICRTEFRIREIYEIHLEPEPRQDGNSKEYQAAQIFNENDEMRRDLLRKRSLKQDREQYLQSVLAEIKELDACAFVQPDVANPPTSASMDDNISKDSLWALYEYESDSGASNDNFGSKTLPKPVVEQKLSEIKMGGENACFIVANVGEYHHGSLLIAKELISLAKECGVSCINFDKLSKTPESNVVRHFFAPTKPPPERVLRFIANEGDPRPEFTDSEFIALRDYAEKEVGIHFMGTAMDLTAAEALCQMRLSCIRVDFGNPKCTDIIGLIYSYKLPVMLSAELDKLPELRKFDNMMKQISTSIDIVSITCSNASAKKQINLNVLDFYAKKYPGRVGFSGREDGIANSLAAVAHKIKVVEKGFALQKGQFGLNYKYSLNPVQMEQFCRSVREIEASLSFGTKPANGLRSVESTDSCNYSDSCSSTQSIQSSSSTQYSPSSCSSEFCVIPRKSIVSHHRELAIPVKSVVAAYVLDPGHEIKLTDLTIKFSQPMGIKSTDLFTVLGKIVGKRIEKFSAIQVDSKTGRIVPAKFDK